MTRVGARARGFTLIELLITMAILAIITSLAVGGYGQYVRRAGRVDATSALLRLASAQEKFYAQNGQYAGPADMTDAPPDGLGIDGTERGYYTLTIEADDPAVAFKATATVDPASNQANDEDCWKFSVNERGLRTATSRDGDTGPAVTDRCWR